MNKGLFIVIDGGDGAGKSSQITRARGCFDNVVTTREPGGSSFAEKIRKLILEDGKDAATKTLFYLFLAARAEHVEKTIRPALKKGKVVICDRFDCSTYAYQIVAGRGRNLQKAFWQMRKLVLGDCKPDLYIYFDISVKVGLARKAGQGAEEQNHFDAKDITFHNALRKGFKEFLPKVRHRIIDATQPPEKVHADFMEILHNEMKRKGIKIKKK